MHPASSIKGTKTRKLEGKLIVLAVTGSIAAVETVKLAHELIRHGADVQAIMSDDAEGFVTKDAIHSATGRVPVTTLTGELEHVALFTGDGAKLMLIAPATANTLSKIAHGVCDTTVTTTATVALGCGVPLIIAPAMHEQMYRSPQIVENLRTLKRLGIQFIEAQREEGKCKMAEVETIAAAAVRTAGPRDMAGRRVLVIAGSTQEDIDEVRVLTNRSSGRTGIELASEAFLRGASVEFWYGQSPAQPPEFLTVRRFRTVEDLEGLVTASTFDFDMVAVPAAIGDFRLKAKKGKIPSGSPMDMRLEPAPKLLPQIRKRCKGKVVGFKLESGMDPKALLKKASEMLREYRLDMLVANDIKEVAPDRGKVHIVIPGTPPQEFSGTKSQIAEAVWSLLVRQGGHSHPAQSVSPAAPRGK